MVESFLSPVREAIPQKSTVGNALMEALRECTSTALHHDPPAEEEEDELMAVLSMQRQVPLLHQQQQQQQQQQQAQRIYPTPPLSPVQQAAAGVQGASVAAAATQGQQASEGWRGGELPAETVSILQCGGAQGENEEEEEVDREGLQEFPVSEGSQEEEGAERAHLGLQGDLPSADGEDEGERNEMDRVEAPPQIGNSQVESYLSVATFSTKVKFRGGMSLHPATHEEMDSGVYKDAELKEWVRMLDNGVLGGKAYRNEVVSVVFLAGNYGMKMKPTMDCGGEGEGEEAGGGQRDRGGERSTSRGRLWKINEKQNGVQWDCA
uniref:Uncharacterized protein n=1 Tax=Chromera velia CCMP2878 TaxID=1169474 RepID=A0A0G4G1Z1_9ALVE|eukprot:Cvel_19861.t1-p1 / transcript=Cvel_19861.t1 / gene=Cvel_19861 / organism=Chromera_velia_CCMP2878 / gene_product=hypothetical protein / transcript_product=hypothetical protein / location=Cvel_scaffold1741:5208-6347(+) / protein_length=321 / sequence_SO=supercontig / SO=protein_coding / is_pseudo=false